VTGATQDGEFVITLGAEVRVGAMVHVKSAAAVARGAPVASELQRARAARAPVLGAQIGAPIPLPVSTYTP